MKEQVSDKAPASHRSNGGAVAARRSTRMFQPVPLNVSGQNKLGNHVSESTSALAVNCHGCLYPSRYGYQTGTWVTVEVIGQQLGGNTRPVRAQVKFVNLPRTPSELYQVGIELESPANIWGIQSPPPDWLQFSVTMGSASESSEPQMSGVPEGQSPIAQDSRKIVSAAARAKTINPSAIETVFSSENLLHALEGMLQQAAEKAVASAVSSRVTMAANQAAKAISDFSQSCVRKVDEHCTQARERFVASVQQDFLVRIQADIVKAQDQLQEQLRKQVETSLAQGRAASQQIQESAAEIPVRLAEARGALQQAAEASFAALQAAAKSEAERLVDTARQNAEHSMAAVAAEWDARQRASQEQVARSVQAEIEQFRKRLESLLNSSMATALAAANEHSRILLDSLLKGTAEQLKHPGTEPVPR